MKRYPPNFNPTSSPSAAVAWGIVDEFDAQTVVQRCGPALTSKQRCLLAGMIAGTLSEAPSFVEELIRKAARQQTRQ